MGGGDEYDSGNVGVGFEDEVFLKNRKLGITEVGVIFVVVNKGKPEFVTAVLDL